MTEQHEPNSIRVHTVLAGLVTVIGLMMLIVTVSLEDEPTAIPPLLIVSGIGWYVATRHRTDPSPAATYRLAAGIALVAAVLLVWLSLGVGIIGEDGNPDNLLYGAVLAAGFIGALVARFRPRGMSRALLAAAFVQALILAFALSAGLGAPWSGPMELIGLNGFFVALFAGSAVLFRLAESARTSPW